MLINLLMTLIAVSVVLATSVLATFKVGLKSKISSLLAIFLFSVANIILVTQIASLLNLLHNRWFILALHLALFVGSLLLSLKKLRSTNLRVSLKGWFT